MQIEPNGLLAGDPLHPLASGHPFFRGNVMQGNGIDGLACRHDLACTIYDATRVGATSGPSRPSSDPAASNQTVSTVWDSTDLTYVLRGTIILDGRLRLLRHRARHTRARSERATAPSPSRCTSLTIQSALPGTCWPTARSSPARASRWSSSCSTTTTPNGAGSLAQFGSTGIDRHWSADTSGGAGFIVGVDDGVDPTASPLVDPGAYCQIRILGIPGNQTTGQQRVPVILTSLRDGTVGITVRGVKMNNIFNCWPTEYRTVLPTRWRRLYAGQTLTTPRPGDGGYIYIGGNSLTDYNLTDPRDGSLIDNADICYMTSIEIQGGGIIDIVNASGTPVHR